MRGHRCKTPFQQGKYLVAYVLNKVILHFCVEVWIVSLYQKTQPGLSATNEYWLDIATIGL